MWPFGRRYSLSQLIARDNGAGIDLARNDINFPDREIIVAKPVRLFASAPVTLFFNVTIAAPNVIFENVTFGTEVRLLDQASVSFVSCAFKADKDHCTVIELFGESARATLMGCDFSGSCTRAIAVTSAAAKLEVEDCRFARCDYEDCCIFVGNAASASIRKCSFGGECSIDVAGALASASIKESYFFVGLTAIICRDGAAVVVSECEFFVHDMGRQTPISVLAGFGPNARIVLRQCLLSKEHEDLNVIAGAFDGALVDIGDAGIPVLQPSDGATISAEQFHRFYSSCRMRVEDFLVADPRKIPEEFFPQRREDILRFDHERTYDCRALLMREYTPRDLSDVRIYSPARPADYQRMSVPYVIELIERLPAIFAYRLIVTDYISREEVKREIWGDSDSRLPVSVERLPWENTILMWRVNDPASKPRGTNSAIFAAWSKLLWWQSQTEAELFELAYRFDVQLLGLEISASDAWEFTGQVLFLDRESDDSPALDWCVRISIYWLAVERHAAGRPASFTPYSRVLRELVQTKIQPAAVELLLQYLREASESAHKWVALRVLAAIDPQGVWQEKLDAMPNEQDAVNKMLAADKPFQGKGLLWEPSRIPELLKRNQISWGD